MEASAIPLAFDPNHAAPSSLVSGDPQIPERPISKFVMVSGIPAMVLEDKIRQIFDHCGLIVDLWRNHLNIWFLEFVDETASRNAVLLAGFTVIIIQSGVRYDAQLFVNYAFEHEAKKSVIPFSKEACNLVSEKLSHESTLHEGTEILTKWLRNGECNRFNAEDFFSLLQLTSASAEKKEENMRKVDEAESKLNAAVSDIADYLNVLEQVFNHENFNSILVNFPEKERQNLLQWKKEFEEAKIEINKEQHKKARNKKNKRSAKKKTAMETISREELVKLRQEKEDLELQLDVANLALVNERIEQQQEINALKQSVFEAQRLVAEYEAQLADWRAIHAKLRQTDSDIENREEDGFSCTEAKIVTELSTYLAERLGATLSDIRNHLRRKNFHCTAKSIATLMRRFPALFKEEIVDSGPTMKIKWVFIGCRI